MEDSKKVIEGLLGRGEITRMGFYELIWPDTLRQWTNEGYPEDEQGQPAEPTEFLDMDMYSVGGWFDTLPIRGYEEIVEETDEWVVRRNGAGASLKFWKNRSGVPEHIDFRMTSREVWERDYRQYLLELDPERVDVETTRRLLSEQRKKGRWAFYGNINIFESMRQSMGDVCLYESVLLDPDWIHDYNRVYTDFFKKHFQYLFEQAGVPDGIWMYEDMGYRGATFCSPEIYDKLVFPYYREMVEFFHGYDLPVILHSCGFVEKLVPYFIDIGFDGLNPMEVKAGCDVVRIAKKYAKDLFFCGGMDIRIFEDGDREAIRSEVIRLTDEMKRAQARFLFATDHSVSLGVKYDDYRLAVDTFRENMYY